MTYLCTLLAPRWVQRTLKYMQVKALLCSAIRLVPTSQIVL